MQNMRKYLLPAFFLAFLLIGINALIESKPSPKNTRVYKTVQQFSPYALEKRFGGLQIINKEDPKFKEKPNNMTIFKEFERLEKEWGKKHLKLKNDTLVILDNNGTTVHTLPLQSKEETTFIHHYYGI
ncbi:hypothetical protein YH65_09825 [Sulfurovum lithotrophicum]|uniref:Uncharacterized protein n=1 Tax=Sulfurovum lithotrophicum TaxID=206403 RepID=A0A7U4M2H0_9BACT|nr:hypothetical protein [Sulfurovum lithotrophicum]AKF25645.1 hypothetical protein YH65_09825 [Sulfurovum lithotrophicum]